MDLTSAQAFQPRKIDPGPPLAVYAVRRERLRQRSLLIFLSLFALLVSAGLAVYRWNFAYGVFGPAVVWRWAQPFLTAAVVFAAFAGLQLYLRHREARHQVSTHARGMLLRGGKQVMFLPWGSIDGIRFSVIRYGFPGLLWGDRSILIIETNDGNRHRLTGALADLQTLIGQVKDKVFPRLLEVYRQRLARGLPLEFGPITLKSDGIHLRARKLSWKQVESASLQSGHLFVQYREDGRVRRTSIPARRIPNADLCRQLIEQIEIGP